jgi:hypothetical protein
VARLRDQRYDCDARVTTDNGYILISWIRSLEFRDEAGGSDDIEGGDTEEPLGVVDTLGLVDFGADRNRRVDL